MSPRRTTKRRGWRTKILGAQSLAAFQLILLALVIVYIVGQFRFLRTANFCLKAELDFKQKTLAVVFSPCATNADATMEAALSASISPKASESSLAAAPRFHLVFSTGCSAAQEWQSYVLFYHVLQSGQSGNVTRIVSGCTENEQQQVTLHFREAIAPLAPGRFYLHLTPDFGNSLLPNVTYKFFNKPWGLRHWMNHGLHYPKNKGHLDDVIFIILDPDQILLRPFEPSLETDPYIVWHTNPILQKSVSHGHPMAQVYMLGTAWIDLLSPNHLFKETYSPVHNWTYRDVRQYYMAGPPYLATGRDMYRLVVTWAEIVAPVYLQTNDHLSEMFAYSVAAGHLNLKHQLASSFMISNPDLKREGWSHIDALSAEQLLADDNNFIEVKQLPQVLHYCQNYGLGPWWFSKYNVFDKFLFTCTNELFNEPACCDHVVLDSMGSPKGLGTMHEAYDWALTTPFADGERFSMTSPIKRKRHAVMLHLIFKRLNEAAKHYRRWHCFGSNINTNKTFFWRNSRMIKEELDAKKASLLRQKGWQGNG